MDAAFSRPTPANVVDTTFAELMASHQTRLEAYIRSLIFDASSARDILQEANIVMLKKSGQFKPGTNFTAWAYRIAWFEVMSWRRRKGRERIVFNDEMLEQVAEVVERRSDGEQERVVALRECIEKLPERQREFITRRYLNEDSLVELAEENGMKKNALVQLLFRARSSLQKCIEQRLSSQPESAQ